MSISHPLQEYLLPLKYLSPSAECLISPLGISISPSARYLSPSAEDLSHPLQKVSLCKKSYLSSLQGRSLSSSAEDLLISEERVSAPLTARKIYRAPLQGRSTAPRRCTEHLRRSTAPLQQYMHVCCPLQERSAAPSAEILLKIYCTSLLTSRSTALCREICSPSAEDLLPSARKSASSAQKIYCTICRRSTASAGDYCTTSLQRDPLPLKRSAIPLRISCA
ncbi:hypothetical protein AVEN_21711-1 [Araneus ventricosus]|uniref:Uncharacterized protein n=1 Tax=Araneus ventricosus TaxID=182803 RepID=A0A4Y2VYP9_ARAVE|nr:hypothetical protein AVEN_21711-1 [Araneus ventricosus]